MNKNNYYYINYNIIEHMDEETNKSINNKEIDNIDNDIILPKNLSTKLNDIVNYNGLTNKLKELDASINLNNEKIKKLNKLNNNFNFTETGININNKDGINNIGIGVEYTNHKLEVDGSARVDSLYLSDGSYINNDNGILINSNDNIINMQKNSIILDSNNVNIGNPIELNDKFNVDGNINLTGNIKHNNNVIIDNSVIDNLKIKKKNINFDGNISISSEDLDKGGLSIGSEDNIANGNLKVNKYIINKFDKKIFNLSVDDKLEINPTTDSPNSTIIRGDVSIINNGNKGGLSVGLSEYNIGDGNLIVTNNSNVLKKINIGSLKNGDESLNIVGYEGTNNDKKNNHSNILLGKYSYIGQTSSDNEKQKMILGNNVKAIFNNIYTASESNDGYRAITLDPNVGIQLYTNNNKTTKDTPITNPQLIINNNGQIIKKINIIDTDNNNITNPNNKIISYVKENLLNKPPGTIIEFLTNFDTNTHTYKALVNKNMVIRIFKLDILNNKTEFIDIGI
jgi:hypothetical protein